MKKAPFICPKCANNDYLVLDYAFDAEYENDEIVEIVAKTCKCTECGEEFDEYYRLTYDGYYHNGQVYDKNGAIDPLVEP